MSQNKELVMGLLSSIDATLWQLEIVKDEKAPHQIKNFNLVGNLHLGTHQILLSNTLNTDLILIDSHRTVTATTIEQIH